MPLALYQLAERFTRRIHVLKQLPAAALPPREAAFQQRDILITPALQALDGPLRQTFAAVIDGNRRRQARHASKNIQLQFAERQISGKQRMAAGKVGLFANIDQRQLRAVKQRLAQLSGRAIRTDGHINYPLRDPRYWASGDWSNRRQKV
ncbi:Uncharacterised protein [Klebsiella oxytoca]|nr:Uncharacterised protein [Klebsiella oxytoca]